MISLNDEQLQILMSAARGLEPERRSQFLERVGAMLKLRGRFGDAAEISERALRGLGQHAADSAA